MKIKTVAYKGSKRKLISQIVTLAKEIDAETIFDGFSGSGIVSANLRQSGFKVFANDMNYSSYIYGKVFLEGFDRQEVTEHIKIMNNLESASGWVTKNYSGEVVRKIRGLGIYEKRPLGFIAENAQKIDAARDYISQLNTDVRTKNALIFSVILASDKVFNNSNDQKSCLKKWTKASLKSICFEEPKLIEGPMGKQINGDIFKINVPTVDMVYLDPPYTHGVLYASCYHLSDSIALWDKPEVDSSYAIPRPLRASFRDKSAGALYSKKTAFDDFKKLLSKFEAKRIVLSFSDAPRNTISIEKLIEIGEEFGKVLIMSKEHQICSQAKVFKKWSTNLKEFFIIIDKQN